MLSDTSNNNESGKSDLISAPTISLPKGGGAIRGMGEKFSAQSATGTGSLSVPLPISPGRGGVQPSLALQYDSGAGNGIFGLGWQLNLPSIARKTDKGLPKYLDQSESDVFLISGAEDLVPITDSDFSGIAATQLYSLAGHNYSVQRYRPRIEGMFAWIERWSNRRDSADTFWRAIDRSNTTQWFGRTAASRIADPADPTRIFQWLPCESYDDKGNLLVFEYIADNEAAIEPKAWETQRTAEARRAQRYLKRVCYGNRTPYFPSLHADDPERALPQDWMFELVFDFGDHELEDPSPLPSRLWPLRPDAFSDYRDGFERRTSRRVERVLMFHHFPESDLGSSALVRSMAFEYLEQNGNASLYSQIKTIESWHHERTTSGQLESRQTPPLEFRYSEPRINPDIHHLTATELDGLPIGVMGAGYQWVDLNGEGLSGVLSELTGVWRYSANLGEGRFEQSRVVATTPAKRALAAGQRLLDLNGNGDLDVVEMDPPIPGYYEREMSDQGWTLFTPFVSFPQIRWDDPNLRFVDLTGDGHADALITENDVLTWYPSLAEKGFGAAETVRPPLGEDGIRLLFSDGTQTLFLADMCGDGLTDLVRIRNGEICFWPNLGYGHFGRKVLMGNPPRFDYQDQFDPRRIRLADIDGSGPTDIVYLGRQGAQVYFNQSGNQLSGVHNIEFPISTLNINAVQIIDLLGRGTACLVWSSHLPADQQTPVHYIDLMGGIKPHLLLETRNNMGGSTEIEYTPSTAFYLADKAAGQPWITRLPFPVQCVSRVTVRDQWRGTAFSSTYTYHHGYYDGSEREFRGFGRVEQTDIEDYGRFANDNNTSPWITDAQELFQPPVKSITWFHTGVAINRSTIISQFEDEYFPARYQLEGSFRENELPEPTLDEGLSVEEWREALRACKGMQLRQEVYELDAETLTQPSAAHRLKRLFSAANHNCRIQRLQARGSNRHAIFLVTASETLSYQYDLLLPNVGGLVTPDPRISHSITLAADELGQPLQTIAIAYPRVLQHQDSALDTDALNSIRAVQNEQHIVYAEARFTADVLVRADATLPLQHHRLRQPCELRTVELTGLQPNSSGEHHAGFYFKREDFEALQLSDIYPLINVSAAPIPVAPIAYHRIANRTELQRRLIEHARALYFDDASNSLPPTTPLAFGQLGVRGLKYEDYKLALTGDFLEAIYQTPASLPDAPISLLDWEIKSGVNARSLLNNSLSSGYQRDPVSGDYWMRSGIAGFAATATQQFFLPNCYTDPFGNKTAVEYDSLALFITKTTDAKGNESAIARDEHNQPRFNYRVLAPIEMVDSNDNHSEAAFDIRGLVVAVANKGKRLAGQWEGDHLDDLGFELINPPEAAVADFCLSSVFGALQEAQARRWLASASTRFVYHFGESRDATLPRWQTRMAGACGIAREIHAGQPGGTTSPLHIALEFSDGSGAVVMKKNQAEPEADAPVSEHTARRWIVNGLTVLNNKGKPVKQYEPFFSANFGFELPREQGVTPIIFYDAAGRVIRTDLPDGTFSRVEFSPWHAQQFDPSDTVLESTWYEANTASSAPEEARRAARLSALHANTPSLSVLDSLGREVIAIAHNRSPSDQPEWRNTPLLDRPWLDEYLLTHTKLDAEGKPLWVRDARKNRVMQYIFPPTLSTDASDSLETVPAYDIAGNLLFQHSMDAGDRWLLMDAAGKPMLAWDLNDTLADAGELQHQARLAYTEYDALHRPVRQWLRLGDQPAAVVECFEYCNTADLDAPALNQARVHNLIGQPISHYDASGLIELKHLKFTGQPQHEERRLVRHTSSGLIDWQTPDTRPDFLEAQTFTRLNEHDALGRMTQLINWHGTGDNLAVYRPHYNARGLLDVENLVIGARLIAGQPSGGRKTLEAVSGITYNAKGQRTRLVCGNGTETRYNYDPRSFRLTQLRTTRSASHLPFPGFRSNLNDERIIQQLRYTYDAIGNISEITDEAYQPVFFRNQLVEPRSLYTYDASQRLIEAKGRESAELNLAPGVLSVVFDVSSFPTDHALRNYTQRYEYDSVGNFVAMRHLADDGNWTRHYATAADSNRLVRSWTGSDDSDAVTYAYDTHGSMLNFANVPSTARTRWDWRDMIEGMDLGGGGYARYTYDTGKQRTRKRIERLGGAVEDRIYLGGMELYRRYAPSGELLEAIETHHLFVDDQRILLMDDVIQTDNTQLGAGVLCKYQYSNHLGSVALELDETAQIISCEELHPYGTTAYHMVGRGVRATAKRYRYTGMERDEESGLSYHTARYYLPWLGRWGSSDPIGIGGGSNLYAYANKNPFRNSDKIGKQAEEEVDRGGFFDFLGGYGTGLVRSAERLGDALETMVEHPLDTASAALTTLDSVFVSRDGNAPPGAVRLMEWGIERGTAFLEAETASEAGEIAGDTAGDIVLPLMVGGVGARTLSRGLRTGGAVLRRAATPVLEVSTEMEVASAEVASAEAASVEAASAEAASAEAASAEAAGAGAATDEALGSRIRAISDASGPPGRGNIAGASGKMRSGHTVSTVGRNPAGRPRGLPLPPRSRALLGPSEIAVRAGGAHPDVFTVRALIRAGVVPEVVASVTKFCPICAATLEGAGIRMIGGRQALFAGVTDAAGAASRLRAVQAAHVAGQLLAEEIANLSSSLK